MKYFAYFRPNDELSNLIQRQNHIILPGSGLHSTLCFFHMKPEHENGLVVNLSQIDFDPFKIETLGFDDFDEDSLVLKLSCSDELLQLHKEIIKIVGNYTNTGQHFRDNYNPHFTISKSSSEFNRVSKELIGREDEIARYSLVKKINGSWGKIQDFYFVR
jgi:hypothetical protein